MDDSGSNKDLIKRISREDNYKSYDDDQQSNDYVYTEDENEDKLVGRCGKSHVYKYRCLLKKLASDLKHLKLNERFHCLRNFSVRSVLTLQLLLQLFIYWLFCFYSILL